MTAAAEQRPVAYAGIISRAGAGVVDVIIFAGISAGTLFFLQAFSAMLQQKPFGDVTLSNELSTLVISFLVWVYFVGSWTVFSRTIGEGLFGLRVTRTDGRRVKFFRAWFRFLVSFLSFAMCGLGFAWMLIDRRRRTWQDLAARTVVVYDFDNEGVHHAPIPAENRPAESR